MSTEKVCSFCHKPESEVEYMLTNDESVCICSECIEECIDYDKNYRRKETFTEVNKVNITPLAIKKQMDDYICGQEEAKRLLSVAMYNHIKRINNPDSEIEKSNVLLYGPTGSGKTLMARVLAKIMDVPFITADATSFTEAGYVGEDVESIIARLLRDANGNIEKAQKGIVYIDEIDKLCQGQEGGVQRASVSREAVQQALLKIVEGSKVSITTKGSHTPFPETVEIDTSNILFICGGAFDGLDKEDSNKKLIGFSSFSNDKGNDGEDIVAEKFRKYGLIPELLGRLPLIVKLNSLDEADLIKILTEPKNSLVNQYKRLFKIDGINLEFEKAALKEIARKAIRNKTGARGLRSIIENSMYDIMFYAPEMKDISEYIITKEDILSKNPIDLEQRITEKKGT